MPDGGMRGSAKGHEPETLCSWKEDQRSAGIEPRYRDLSGAPQQATKEALFFEQTGQCVYCGRGIDLEERNRHHIEHFRPRSLYPDCQLAYENLFLSCGLQQPQGSAQQPTCGNRKGNWFDEDCHVEPAPEEDCQRRFVFASGGRVQGNGSLEADRMIKVLNLNHLELIADRSALIEYLDGELEKGVPLHELIKSHDDVSSDGTRVSFANVAVQYLKKQGGCAKPA